MDLLERFGNLKWRKLAMNYLFLSLSLNLNAGLK